LEIAAAAAALYFLSNREGPAPTVETEPSQEADPVTVVTVDAAGWRDLPGVPIPTLPIPAVDLPPAPDLSAPGFSVPMPSISAPDVSRFAVPGFSVPMPSISAPDVSRFYAPGFSVPMPSISAPDVSRFAAPGFSVPMPSISAPPMPDVGFSVPVPDVSRYLQAGFDVKIPLPDFDRPSLDLDFDLLPINLRGLDPRDILPDFDFDFPDLPALHIPLPDFEIFSRLSAINKIPILDQIIDFGIWFWRSKKEEEAKQAYHRAMADVWGALISATRSTNFTAAAIMPDPRVDVLRWTPREWLGNLRALYRITLDLPLEVVEGSGAASAKGNRRRNRSPIRQRAGLAAIRAISEISEGLRGYLDLTDTQVVAVSRGILSEPTAAARAALKGATRTDTAWPDWLDFA